ncbi:MULTISPECIES: DUF447 domain-containing protein [Haloarcula]|uniref:DUF447 family protein n=1 Tax=Haloarcula pellucida TaxID=1427151 RepID=A0A830GJB0_9EURY|nr:MULTISPECIES: DUF447 domain-containing protein [Halomicroarcula]MBX0347827.1 DUF447 family protein [Halomicroarcula pellucida]MDS0276239.1 DUF447 family protein [Halomicroarcula sp. S1AR25-4]GGN90469.1 hypothetical protein GCM10009030_12510 [Halomicroarcula pellucida]
MGETDWPAELAGVTESVVTTLGPNDRWNVAALGLTAPDGDGPVTATTWGRTRTWRNFRERGEGYVQFTRDPVDFAEAALSVREEADPVLERADAWVRVGVERLADGEEGGTQWVEWALRPVESGVERRVVPTTNRGHAAVVEATVAASRLDVPTYDRETLLDRLAYFESVVETAGSEREREAFERVRDLVDAEW